MTTRRLSLALVLVLTSSCALDAGDSASSADELTPGSASGPTKLSVPSKIANLRSDAHVIAGYLDVTHYGADPTGVKDSTAAFQSALNDAGSNANGSIGASMVVYVPSGTYKITNTVTGYQIFIGKNVVNGNFGAGSGILAPTLVGPANGPRPTIVLQDGTFTDATHPHPMLHMVNTPNAGSGGCGGQYSGNTESGCWDILFNSVVRDIDFKVGKNAGAIGVQFYSAQMSYMQNVKVDATGGYAGIQGSPATDAWVNIEVDGGEYGIIVDRTAGTSAIAGLILANQSIAGVRAAAIGNLSITGFDIRESGTATGVLTSERAHQGDTLTMIDGYLAATGAPAISNDGNVTVYLANAFLRAPHTLLVNGTSTVASTGAVQNVERYAHIDPSKNRLGSGFPAAGSIVLDDKTQTTDDGPHFGTTSMPADLAVRNVPAKMPWAFDSRVVWVTDHGADPTGVADSTNACRAAIAAAHSLGSDEVFVPRGKYAVSGTIVTNPNTKLFGVPGGFSQITAPRWNPGNTIAYYLQVGDAKANAVATKAGTAIVSDLLFSLPTVGNSTANALEQAHLAAVKWETGAHSIGNQVYALFQYNNGLQITPPARDVFAVQGGGGRFYGLQLIGDYGPNDVSGHVFLVENTTERTSVYGSNIEHGHGTFYGVVDASNVRILGAKTEPLPGGHTRWFHLSGASNVMISGLTNHDSRSTILIDSDCANVELNTLNYFSVSDLSAPHIIDSAATYSYADNYALFTKGSFSDTVFAGL